MSEFGITRDGFEIKPFQRILEDKASRAREMFGPDADLRSTSALRKILDVASFEDHELWKLAQQLYYSVFPSTASGEALDLLGDDVGVGRPFLAAGGKVRLKLGAGIKKDRQYPFPLGTLVETAAGVRFRTLVGVMLSEQNKEKVVEAEALKRGPEGNVPANAIVKIN